MPKAYLRFKPVATISPQLMAEAWAFMERYVVWSRPGFESATRSYSEALIYRDSKSREIVGLSFLKEVRVVHEGRPNLLLLTALTVIDERFRGQNLVQRAGLISFLRARLRYPALPIYWMFMARSYKSYLLLSRNFRDYWPKRGSDFPPREKALLNAAARETFGHLWDGQRGVVALPEPCPWRPGTLELTPKALEDPDIRYFAERAPGWRDSEALGCLSPLSLSNWASILNRWAARGYSSPKRSDVFQTPSTS